MALTVGTDTYLTVEDATAYVTAHYPTTHERAIAWAALSDGDKEINLRRAAQIIDRQPFVGIKAVSNQAMAFPRAILTDYSRRDLPILNTHFDSDWLVQSETPAEIGYAQTEIALVGATGAPKRLELQQQGVTSFSLGKLSESYGGGSGASRLLSYEAKELLAPYIAGSVRIA